jgi:hypothetical protein
MCFGYGGQGAWSLQYTNWETPATTALVATNLGAEDMTPQLVADLAARPFPFFSAFPSDISEAALGAYMANASALFDGTNIVHGTSTYGDTGAGFANYNTSDYMPCQGEMAFAAALTFTIRSLGPLHEDFNQGSQESDNSGGGPSPSDISPTGALIALGVLCGLVVLCILCYSYYPEDELKDAELTTHE